MRAEAIDWWTEMNAAPATPASAAGLGDFAAALPLESARAAAAPSPRRLDMPPIPGTPAPTTPHAQGVDWWTEMNGGAARGQQGAPEATTYPSYDPERSAGLRATAIASLASDPEQRIQYYARERGLPPSRYRAVGPRVAYQADDGQWYYEESPNFWPHSFTEAAQQVAGSVGGALPTLAGTLTGIASAPLVLAGPAGLGASVAATGGAAAGAEAVRQALADQFVSPSAPDRMKIAEEGLYSGLGQGIGAGMTALGQKYAAPELTRATKHAAQRATIKDRAEALNAKARGAGIHLTPAESTNLPSLKAQQKMLGNMPQSADEMAAFYEHRQREQIAPAVTRFMDDISSESSPAVAGARVRDVAAEAIEAAKQQRTRQVRPLYEAVVIPDNVVPVTVGGVREAGTAAQKTAMGELMNDRFLADQVRAVKSNPLYRMGELEDTSLPVLDQVKKNLDDMIEVAKRSGERNKVRLLEQRRASLLKAADDAFPEYSVARAAFEARSPEVDEIANSVLGVVSKLKDTDAKRAAATLFSDRASSPVQIGVARRNIEAHDPAAWQDIKRAWLQLQWVKAGQEPLTGDAINQGAKWRQLLLGNETRREHMRAALTTGEFKALSDLADVLEATGRVKPIGSDTAWNEEMKRLTRHNTTPLWAKITSTAIQPQEWGRLMREWASERALSTHAADVARIIQDPDAMQLLRQLRVMGPEDARFRAGVGHLLTRFATSSAGRTAPTQEDHQ